MTVDPDIMRQIKLMARRADQSLAERDRLIREAYEQGAGLREIGRAAGLTHPAIRKIIDRNQS